MSQQYGAINLSPSSNVNPNEVRSLWIGDLQYWMDENYLSTCFYHTGEVIFKYCSVNPLHLYDCLIKGQINIRKFRFLGGYRVG